MLSSFFAFLWARYYGATVKMHYFFLVGFTELLSLSCGDVVCVGGDDYA
jgi:hypothetical protein